MLYVETQAEVVAVATRIAAAGANAVTSPNSYWNQRSRIFLDPDGHRLVVAIRSLGPGPGARR